jgi:hypothetical protein
MSPIVALTLRADELDLFIAPELLERDKKIFVALFTVVHIYNRIFSPLHMTYTTFYRIKTFP